MSLETAPDKKSDSASDSSVQPTEQFKNIDQLTKALQSFIEQIAKLIVTKNWFSLLLLIDAVLILFFLPGGVVSEFIKTTLAIELPEQYPIFFWVAVGGIFLTALVIAIRTIQKKSPSAPNFTERKAIKGLRAFTKEDAEIFALLERERDLRECLESITSKTFRIGILIGESGVGKSSFLQAGIIPQLAKSDSSHRGVYIRFSNQEPIASIYKALAEELQFSATETNNHNLLEIFSLAVATADKPLILIFDQFEQFFVHFKQKQDREPFINALKDWYCGDNPLPIKILISIREDLSGRLIDLQKALGYSLSPYEVFRLEKFTPESATKILQVIAQAEEIKFDEKFVNQLTAEELASREDGLISPVDLQVLAWTIERQNKELRAFNRTAFQKIGGIEGLMIRFLKTSLDARVIPRQREAAIKVLLAMTDLERNVRVGALTVEEIKENTKGTLNPAEILEAVTWLASGGVRLITTIEQDGDVRYELAHERLIPALREEARRKLTSADRANQLLNRRVNEWLGNQKSNRYLFNWQELRLFQQQKPYLVWGANQIHKENLLKRSWRKLTRQLIAVGMAIVFSLVGIGWWHTPWGQIQQVRWELAGLSQRVNNEYRGKAALAFFKDERFNQALAITDLIKSSSYRAEVLIAIAETIGQLENFPQAGEYLDKALTAAEQIADSDDRAEVLVAIAEISRQLENFPQVTEFLDKAFTAAQQMADSDDRARVLSAIAEISRQLENFPQVTEFLDKAFTAAQQMADSADRARVLSAIAETIGQLENFPQATESLDKALTAAQQINYSPFRAWVLSAIAKISWQLENFPQATESLDKAWTAAQQINDSAYRARVLSAIAETIGQLENFPQATESLDKAWTAAQQIADSDDRAGVLIEIAKISWQLENFPQATESLDKALTAAQQIDNSYHRASVLRKIAETIGQLENFSQATESLDKALTAAEQIDDSDDRARVLSAIAETIGQLENFPQATESLDKVLTAAQQIADSDDRARVLSAIAETIGQLENFPQATEFLDKALTAAQQIDNLSDRAEVLIAIAKISWQLENFPQATESLDKALTAAEQIADSSYRARVLVAITQTQVKFSYWRQAHNTVSKCPTDECRVESLAHILTGWAEKKNPALVDKKED